MKRETFIALVGPSIRPASGLAVIIAAGLWISAAVPTWRVEIDSAGRVVSVEKDILATDGEFRRWQSSATFTVKAEDAAAAEAAALARWRVSGEAVP